MWHANDPKKAAASFALPAALFAPSDKHTLKLVEWSTDNRHMLVEHVFTGGHEFMMIDRESLAESVNLSRVFSRTPPGNAARQAPGTISLTRTSLKLVPAGQ